MRIALIAVLLLALPVHAAEKLSPAEALKKMKAKEAEEAKEDIKRLRDERDALRNELDTLKKENAFLKNEVARLRKLADGNDAAQRRIKEQEQEIRRLRLLVPVDKRLPGSVAIDKAKLKLPIAEDKGIRLGITSKGFNPSNVNTRQFSSYVTLNVVLHNNRGVDIKGAKISMVVKDKFDDEIIVLSMKVDAIKKDGILKEEQLYEYNQFIDSHQRFRALDIDSMKIEISVEKVLE